MKPNRLLPLLLAFPLLASLAPAQTATWWGQTPPDPTRLSSWTDGTNWSTGTGPNGATAVAQVDQAYSTPSGFFQRDNLQILNSAVTLDRLQYSLPVPYYYYYYPYLGVPSITIGGTGAGDSGSLEFTGAGISSLTAAGYTYPAPALRLQNGTLIFSNSAQVTVSTDVTATMGTNRVWLRDNANATRLNVTLGPGSRLDVTNQARMQSSNVYFNGGEVVFSDQSSLQNVYFALNGAGLINFTDQTVATSPSFFFGRPAPANDSIVRFSGHTLVQYGNASSYSDSGTIEFIEQADSQGFGLNYVRQLDVTGATTGTGTTGRQRATVNTPTATSVVADDARIINLGNVTVEDLLLGSNSVRVTGGNLRYISDVGGAYLSADGSNLTGGGLIVANSSTYFPLTLMANSTAPSPYAVPLTIESGSVITDRQKVGAVTIAPAGGLTLRAGTSASILNNGYVSVAAANYLVTGNYTQTATGTLTVSVPYAGFSVPHLEIAGQAALAGSLQIYGGATYFVGSRRFSFLRAGSITGSFASTPSYRISPMLSVGVEQSGNEMFYVYTQRPFVNAGATPSQQALGAHLDATLPTTTGAHYNLIYGLNAFQDSALIAAGLGQLAPDRYGVLNEQGFATAAARQAATDRRLAARRAAPAPAHGFTTFVEGGQLQNKFTALEGLPEVEMKSSGGLAGATWQQGRWIVGATLAKDRARADLDIYGSSARLESTTPGLFAQYDAGRFFVSAAASRSDDDYTLVRNSGLVYRPSVSGATVPGSRTDLALTTGTTFKRQDWSLTPYAGILSSRVKLDAFAEKRVSGYYDYALAFNDWSVRSLRTRAGFDLTRATARGRVFPRLSVVWLHELEKDRAITAGLISAGGARYRAPGRPAETDLVQASLGLDWRITQHLGFSLNAGLARGQNSRTTSDLSAGFRWEF